MCYRVDETCPLVASSRATGVRSSGGGSFVLGLAKGAVKIVLDVADWADKISQQVPSVSTIVPSERTLNQAEATMPAADAYGQHRRRGRTKGFLSRAHSAD